MEIAQKKIAKILSLLTKEEVKSLKKWLQSPYFVKTDLQPIYLNLLDILLKAIAAGESFDFVESQVSIECYDGANMAKGKVDKMFSQLGKYVYSFWASEKSKESNQGGIEIAKILRKRRARDLWESQFKKISKEVLKEGRTFDNAYYWEALQLELEELDARNKDPRSSIAPNVRAIINRLNDLYIHNGLYLGIQASNVDRFVVSIGLKDELKILKELIQDVDHNLINPGQSFLIKLYHLLLNVDQVKAENVTAIMPHSQSLREEYTKTLYVAIRTIIRNFLIHFYNQGDSSLEGDILKMYQVDFKNNAIFYNSKIHAATVNNISTLAIRQKKYDWLSLFLDGVSKSIFEVELQKFTIALNRAKLFFAQNEFERALDLLDFEVKDFFSKMNVRLIEIMVLYELKSPQLDSKIDAHKVFIHRVPESKVVKKFIDGHNNFIVILNNISSPQNALSLKKLNRIREKVLAMTLVAEKAWLISKIDQLRKTG